MKNFNWLTPLLFLSLPLHAEQKNLTLNTCYDQALKTDETLRRLQENIVQANQRARAALGGALPFLSWNWQGTRQDEGHLPDSAGGFLEKSQVESKISLDQSLFSGLREFSARAGFKREEARNALILTRAKGDLFDRVAQAFYDVVSLESARFNTDTVLELTESRVKEIQSFLKLGKAKDSELYSAQSAVASVKAERVKLLGNIRAAREELSYQIGLPVDDRLLVLSTNPLVNNSLDVFLRQSHHRSDLNAQREEVAAQRLRIRYEKGAYWPNARLLGNYYTQRPKAMDSVDWDLMLMLNVPFYQGGAVSARVREAESLLRQSEDEYVRLERRIHADVRKAYAQWRASDEESQAREEATQAARLSYEAQTKEYRLGLVTNLDVLQALRTFYQEKRAWDDALIETQRKYVSLLIVTEAQP